MPIAIPRSRAATSGMTTCAGMASAPRPTDDQCVLERLHFRVHEGEPGGERALQSPDYLFLARCVAGW